MSLQLFAACFSIGIAMAKYDFAKRTRNALLCGVAGAVGALLENLALGDALRAATFIPVCFAIAGGGTYLAYTITHRYKRCPPHRE